MKQWDAVTTSIPSFPSAANTLLDMPNPVVVTSQFQEATKRCRATAVHLSEGRGQNNQQPTPNDNKSEWWSSSAVLVFNLHRGMCYMPSGKVQEGREGFLWGIYATGDGIDSSSAYHSG